MERLDESLKKRFYEDGYCVIPGVIPQAKIKAALKAINVSLGQGLDPGRLESFTNRSFCPELMQDPRLMGVFSETRALAIAQAFIGQGVVKAIHEAQIALRFPQAADAPQPPSPHIDGFYAPANGVEKGQIYSFTALAGVYLNDIDDEWAGNFTVWPGSHLTLQSYFRQHEPVPSLPNGIPPVTLGAPKQIKAKAGDLIFCHYQLAHAAAINLSAHVRYALFFRLEHNLHHQQRMATLLDIWQEWAAFKA